MQIKVRVFLGDKQIEPSDIHLLTIKSGAVDRIINDVIDRNPCLKARTV